MPETDLWETPESEPATPTVDADEGYPEPSGWTPVEVWRDQSSNPRAAKRLKGVNYSGATSPEDVDSGRWNEYIRQMYYFWCRLRRLNWILVNLGAGGSGVLIAGDGYTNFSQRHFFDATGNASTLALSWEDGDDDMRSLSINGGKRCAGPWGMYGTDNTNDAMILDISFQGESGGVHYANVTFDKALNADANSGVWLVQDYVAQNYPARRLYIPVAERTDPIQCVYSVKTWHSVFSSFATAYPSEPMAAGIDGAYYCAKMNDPSTDLSGFSGPCNYTSCPNYVAWTQDFPTAYDITAAYISRGDYRRQLVAGSGDYSNLRFGREDWSGMLQLIGAPVRYNTGGLYLPAKLYYGFGVLATRVGDTDGDGYDEFETFASATSDAHGTVYPVADQVSKRDPAGGASYASRNLVADSDRTPGHAIERSIGVRRIGEIGMGESAEPSGSGDAKVQRVFPRRYVSPRFLLTEPGVYEDGETRVTVYGSSQTDAFVGMGSYNVKWEVPRYCESVANPATPHMKSVSGSVISGSIAGDLLTVEFALGSVSLTVAGVDPNTTTTASFDCGGNVVKGNMAWDISNVGCSRTTGDRQALLYPGDQMSFDAVAVDGIFVTCVAAEPYGGSTDGSASGPPAGAVGVPDYVATNYAKRDKAIFLLEGRSGEIIRAWVNGGGLSSPVAIDVVRMGAVTPPSTDYEGTSTGYAPSLSIVASQENEASLSGSVADYDANTGTLYLNLSAYPTALVYNLYYAGYVHGIRRDYPCENAVAMDRFLDHICNGYYGGSFSGQVATISYSGGYIGTEKVNFPKQSGDATDVGMFGSWDWTLAIEPWSGTGNIGASMHDPAQASRTTFILSYSFPGMVFSGFGLGRASASEVTGATIDISIESPSLIHHVSYFDNREDPPAAPAAWTTPWTGSWDYDGAVRWEVIDDPEVTSFALVGWKFTVDEYGVVTDSESIGWGSVNLTSIDDGGTTYWRGTGDILAIAQYLAANPLASNERVGIFLGINDDAYESGSVPNAADLWRSWIFTWEWLIDEAAEAELEEEAYAYQNYLYEYTHGMLLSQDGVGWSNLRVSCSPSAIDFHFDHEKQTTMPDLMYDPEA